MKKIIFLWGLLLMSNLCNAKLEQIVLGGGCFWCLESDFDKLPGVTETVSGYDGGTSADPSYEKVSKGGSSYVEVVRVTFDTNKISLDEILDYFWKHVDPTDPNGQFCDKGAQYRTAIFYKDADQKNVVEKSKKKVSDLFKDAGLQVYTDVLPSTNFTATEGYHQDYYNKNPLRYKYYRWNCGRDKKVEELRKKVWDDQN